MPSRAELRRSGEWVLRAALVALLALALWRALHESAPGTESRATRASSLAPALNDATRGPHVGALDVEMDALPTPPQRAWLAALRSAGVALHWHGAVPALALSAERVREPDAPVRVLFAADTGVAIALSDSAGALDSLRASGGGGVLEAADIVGAVRAKRGDYSASAVTPAPADRRGVLVLGRASWESRFVLAALSEAGWQVRGRLPPGTPAATLFS